MSVTAMFPRDILKQADIYHLPSTDDAQSFPADGSPDEANITVGIVPLSSHKRALLGIDEHNTFEMFADDDVDVREGDKLIIDRGGSNEQQYHVHNVDTYDFGGHPHKNCVIIKAQA